MSLQSTLQAFMDEAQKKRHDGAQGEGLPKMKLWIKKTEEELAKEKEQEETAAAAEADAMEDEAAPTPASGEQDDQAEAGASEEDKLKGDDEAAAAAEGQEGEAGGNTPKKVKKDEWRLVEEIERKQKLETFQFPALQEFLLEEANAEGVFPRKDFLKDWRDFAVGDLVDCVDTMGKWYESTITDVKDKTVFVHFNGWSKKWDEWIDKDSDRMAPVHTHTTGPHEAQKKPSGYGAGGYSTRGYGSGGGYYSSWSSNQEGTPVANGVVGLRNLGNTCFMNSTIQCLSNTQILTQWLVDDKYLEDLNINNPLGWNGKVAEAWAALMKEMWSGKYVVVSPTQFKRVIGEFQPRFSGYQQQDSSELLNFLLDGLHEDLNRVKEKPFTESVDSNGRPDKEVAQEAWETHLKRNRSVVIDHFTGQLKSTVHCPRCDRTSITFDPFVFFRCQFQPNKNAR
eukprot:GABV01000006.1.p1 GENE.GABV01000006.1~~GABV01000006.1.p1  ORF type:complete len:453 (-),score=229.42 GABV01000006.1:1245-2603(-)